MKIRWFEVLVLALTVLTALIFLLNYLATVHSGEVTVTVWRGEAYSEEEAPGKGVERWETKESARYGGPEHHWLGFAETNPGPVSGPFTQENV